MNYIDISSIGALSSVIKNSSFSPSIGGGGILSYIFSFYSKKRRLTKAQRRKLARRRRRMFVDNIVMHHKRLHDRNRQIVIDLTRSRSKSKKLKPSSKTNILNHIALERDPRWQEKFKPQERALVMKDRINARRIRARSRWVSIAKHAEQSRNSTKNSNRTLGK